MDKERKNPNKQPPGSHFHPLCPLILWELGVLEPFSAKMGPLLAIQSAKILNVGPAFKRVKA